MRSFRGDRENIRDTRLAYTFLISLAAVCTVLGIVTTKQGSKLHAYELKDCYRSMILCSDALSEWQGADSEESRYAAWFRFDEAVGMLPYGVDAMPLKTLSSSMKNGDEVSAAVRAYSETFLLLSSLDYENGDEAVKVMAETLSSVNRAIDPNYGTGEEPPQETEPASEVINFSRSTVKRSIKNIFGGRAGAMDPILSEDRQEWYAESSNLRMTFSAVDGSLTGFVCLHVGHVPDDVLSESERLSSAVNFFNANTRRGQCVSVSSLGEFCGFLTVELDTKEECYRAAVDSSGRVWSLTKVKR